MAAKKNNEPQQDPERPTPPTDTASETSKASEVAGIDAADSSNRRDDPGHVAESPARGFPVVGIGSSAGGLDACNRFFNAMPADSGMAFLVVPHLDPSQKSLMVELLSRKTVMPVREAKQNSVIEANCVYVIPPGKYMSIHEGRLQLYPPVDDTGRKTALDCFFRDLAKDLTDRAIGIILSGTGSHGSVGLKEIKLAGGMVMVQEPKTAEFDQMPLSAISTGLVDFILPPEDMPETLIRFARHPYLALHSATPIKSTETPELLPQILQVVRAQKKYDFRGYRQNMVLRRVQRRMGLKQINDLAEYLGYLRKHSNEVTALYKDMLIGVTAFFREAEAFDVLQERVIPTLVADSSDDNLVRVWVPGCSTGEEAYSLAMLFMEEFSAAQKPTSLQVFATDIDEDSLEFGRNGIYTESTCAEVSPHRLQTFFTRKDDHHYQINKRLREAIVFAAQNLVGDAPFSKVDLISCRNLLIYLEPRIQQKVISLFHFALNENGVLLLGPSESIGQHADLFEPISKKWRVYRRIGRIQRELVEIPIVATADRGLPLQHREPAPVPSAGFKNVMHKLVLDDYAPAAILMSRKYEILYMLGPLVDYLEFPAGEITKDLMSLARQGLRTKVRAACHKAVRDWTTVIDSDAWVRRGGQYVRCKIKVKPIREPKDAAGLLLLTFEDVRSSDSAPTEASSKDGHSEVHILDDSQFVQQLEYELKTTREDLQSSIEELESSNEELKASHEEVMSMNEELQSANEELETSKEELQSLNEELSTVNQQLQAKLDELDNANDDMINLLASSEIATVFLDVNLRIRQFTPATQKLFNLLPTDIGRPITDISPKFRDKELIEECRRVLQDSLPIEKEVWEETAQETSGTRHCYLRRILPYRSGGNEPVGVVVTFIDITWRTQAEAESRRLATVLRDSNDAVIVFDLDGNILNWNRGAEKSYGYSQFAARKMNIRDILPPDRAAEFPDMQARIERGQACDSFESQRVTKQGGILDVWLTATSLTDNSGRPVAVATTERDMTLHKQRERELARQNHELAERMVERGRLQHEILEIAGREQRRIGQDLHDDIGQEVTGATLMADTLATSLTRREVPEARTASELVNTLQRIAQNVQRIARGLNPVDIDGHGLMVALHELTQRTGELPGIQCTFECPSPVLFRNNQVATDLFRIAQESITNALKHGHAGKIVVHLEQHDDACTLQIRDDGVGFSSPDKEHQGMGVRIMQYRANLIGGKFSIEHPTEHGTVVTCIVPLLTSSDDDV